MVDGFAWIFDRNNLTISIFTDQSVEREIRTYFIKYRIEKRDTNFAYEIPEIITSNSFLFGVKGGQLVHDKTNDPTAMPFNILREWNADEGMENVTSRHFVYWQNSDMPLSYQTTETDLTCDLYYQTPTSPTPCTNPLPANFGRPTKHPLGVVKCHLEPFTCPTTTVKATTCY